MTGHELADILLALPNVDVYLDDSSVVEGLNPMPKVWSCYDIPFDVPRIVIQGSSKSVSQTSA